MSASAARPVSDSRSSAVWAATGDFWIDADAPSAKAIITERLWATTSCISRAIRARSAAVASWLRCSASRARALPRSTSSVTCSRRLRTLMPIAMPSSSTTPSAVSVGVRVSESARSATVVPSVAAERPRLVHAIRDGRATATAYTAKATPRSKPSRPLKSIAAAMLFSGLEGFDLGVAFAVYAVAVARPSRIAWTSLGLSAATLGTTVALRADSGTRTPTLTALGVVLLLGIAIGISVRNRRLHVTGLVERGNALSRDAEQRSQLVTAAERARIAREMHDVVAHSLSVMIALADGASASIQKSPVAAQAALDRLSETGRAALADMRRVLGVLRDGDASFEPAPGGPDLHTLVQSYRDAGMPVQLTVSGTALPTDTGLQLAMYRIVQESLTNALRHTSGSGPVTVVVAHTPGNVDIRVTSPEDPGQDSPKPRASSTPGGGRGIIGMRERAAIYGGTVEAGPMSLGWRVRADLHWDEEGT